MTTDYTPETITIQLTKGQVATIDAIDADLADFKWFAIKTRSGYYAARGIPTATGRTTIRLSRVILERILGRPLAKGEMADHEKGDTLNNRRENLRLATNTENCRNQKRRNTNTSGYKGVWHDKRRNKWLAQIKVNGKNIFLGYHDDPLDAAKAYNDAATKHFGEFARLNDAWVNEATEIGS